MEEGIGKNRLRIYLLNSYSTAFPTKIPGLTITTKSTLPPVRFATTADISSDLPTFIRDIHVGHTKHKHEPYGKYQIHSTSTGRMEIVRDGASRPVYTTTTCRGTNCALLGHNVLYVSTKPPGVCSLSIPPLIQAFTENTPPPAPRAVTQIPMLSMHAMKERMYLLPVNNPIQCLYSVEIQGTTVKKVDVHMRGLNRLGKRGVGIGGKWDDGEIVGIDDEHMLVWISAEEKDRRAGYIALYRVWKNRVYALNILYIPSFLKIISIMSTKDKQTTGIYLILANEDGLSIITCIPRAGILEIAESRKNRVDPPPVVNPPIRKKERSPGINFNIDLWVGDKQCKKHHWEYKYPSPLPPPTKPKIIGHPIPPRKAPN